MASLKTLVILIGLGAASAATGAAAAPVQTAPRLPVAPAALQAQNVDFSIRLAIPGVKPRHHGHHRRAIGPRRAIGIATHRVPMRVRSVVRTPRALIVHGVNRGGLVSVSVHRFSGRILDVDFRRGRPHRGHGFKRHDGRHHGRHLERRGSGLDIVVQNDDRDRRGRHDDRDRRRDRDGRHDGPRHGGR